MQGYLLNYLKSHSKFTIESILDHSPIKAFEYIEHYNVLSAFCGPDAVLHTGNSTKEE